MSTFWTVILVLLVLGAFGGGWRAGGPTWGIGGAVVVILLVVLLFAATGNIRLN